MSSEYRVKAEGHTHAGKPLAVGDVVLMPDEQAERYPAIFERVAAAPRRARNETKPAAADVSAKPQSDTPEE